MKQSLFLVFIFATGLIIQGCKKDATNANPKVTITSPLQNPHQKYKTKQLLHFIYSASDVDGLTDIQAIVRGGGVTFFQSDTTLSGQGEFSMDAPFTVDSVYGKNPMNCAAIVTATDTKGGVTTMKFIFEVYLHP